MKEFNLELAKQGKPVRTRDGKPARIICFDKEADSRPIVALVKIGGTEMVYNYTNDGKYVIFEKEHPLDLMMAAEKKGGWMAIYKNCEGYFGGYVKPTREEAESERKDCVDIVYITWEE